MEVPEMFLLRFNNSRQRPHRAASGGAVIESSLV